uniref:Ig-like domain-containing protein n=1 Tax=Myripristis murdjan TaxID=586833 RepID=A0A667Z2L3_9TELE
LVSAEYPAHPYLLLASFLLIPAGQPQLIGPPQPIVAIVVGDDVILPSHLEPATDAADMPVDWMRPDLDHSLVHQRYKGQEVVTRQNPSYVGRTSLFTDKLKHGNVSLKLSEVKLSDEGGYRCLLPSLPRESFIELIVGKHTSKLFETNTKIISVYSWIHQLSVCLDVFVTLPCVGCVVCGVGQNNRCSTVMEYFICKYCINIWTLRVDIASLRIDATFMSGFYDRICS